MPLTVGVNAYDDVTNVRAFFSERGNADWDDVEDGQASALIIKATDWVDRNFSFIGDKATGEQRLKWPRRFAEVDGFTIAEDIIPWQLKEATAQIAELYRDGTFDLEGVITDEQAALTSRRVDVIEVSYDTTRRILGGAIPTHVYELLQPLIIGNTLRRG